MPRTKRSFFEWLSPARNRKQGSDIRSLLRVSYTSWALLTSKEKLFFIVRIAFRLALNGLDIVAVALMGLLGAITATGLSGQNLRLFNYAVPTPTATNVTTLVALVAGLFILKGGLAIIFSRWTSIFLSGVEIKNSARIARYLFSGSLTRLKKHSRAEIQFLVERSVSATFSGVLGSMTTLIIEGTLFVSILVMFLVVDWIAAIAILGYFLLLITILQLTTARRYLQSGRNLQSSAIDAGSSILEMVDGYREIAVLSKQDYFLARYIEARKLDARTGVSVEIL
jgi:ABC-type multidrug transport system fused ATPase/permease subunit